VKILSDNHVLTDTDTVITVGTFDGIHLGHKSIIQKLTETARKRNCKSVVFTFNNHPRNVLQSDKWLKLITTIQERNTLLSQMGVDYIYIQDFTKSFSQLTGSAFIQSMLIEKLNLKHLIVGYDHHFGRDRLGDINTIKNIGLVSGFDVSKVEPLEIGNIKVSTADMGKKSGWNLASYFGMGVSEGTQQAVGSVDKMTAEMDAYLPHSPSEKGALQALDQSAFAIPKTMADGINAGTSVAVDATAKMTAAVNNELGKIKSVSASVGALMTSAEMEGTLPALQLSGLQDTSKPYFVQSDGMPALAYGEKSAGFSSASEVSTVDSYLRAYKSTGGDTDAAMAEIGKTPGAVDSLNNVLGKFGLGEKDVMRLEGIVRQLGTVADTYAATSNDIMARKEVVEGSMNGLSEDALKLLADKATAIDATMSTVTSKQNIDVIHSAMGAVRKANESEAAFQQAVQMIFSNRPVSADLMSRLNDNQLEKLTTTANTPSMDVVSPMMDSVTRTNYVARADNPVADSITSELDKRRTAVSTEQDKEAIVAIDSRMKSSSASKSGYARKELSEIINLKNDAELSHFKSLVQSMPDVLGVEIIDMVNNREKELVSQAKEIDTIAAEIASRNFESQSEFQTYLDSLKLTERFSTDNLDVLQAKLAEVGAANPVEKQEVAGIDIGGWLNKGFKSVPGRVDDANQRIGIAKSQQAERVKASRESNITGVVELLASDDKEKGATLNTIKTRLIKIQTEAEIEGFTEGQKMYAQTQGELMQGAEKSSWYNPMSWLSTGGDGAKKQDTFTGIKHQNMQAAQNASIWVDAETSLKEMKGAIQKSMMEVDTFDDFVKRRNQLGLYMKQTDIESYKHKWEEMESTKYYASQMNTASKERGKGVEARLGRNVKEQMSSTGLGSSELGKLAFGMADLTKGADGTYSRDLKTGATPDGEAAILDTVLQKTHELKATRDGMYKSEELKMVESIDLVGKLLGLDSARVAAAKERYQTEVIATRKKEFERNLAVASLDENSKKQFELIEKYGVEEGTLRHKQNRIVEGTQAVTNRRTESETAGMSDLTKGADGT